MSRYAIAMLAVVGVVVGAVLVWQAVPWVLVAGVVLAFWFGALVAWTVRRRAVK